MHTNGEFKSCQISRNGNSSIFFPCAEGFVRVPAASTLHGKPAPQDTAPTHGASTRPVLQTKSTQGQREVSKSKRRLPDWSIS